MAQDPRPDSKSVFSQTRVMGIADFLEEGTPNSVAFCRSIDYRTNPNEITLLPATVKESGNVVTDLPKWGDIIPTTSALYYYGSNGNIYLRTLVGSHSFLRTVANSHGNGMGYFREDDFLYYTSDKLVGRYGPISSASPQFVDDFFGSQGGVPQNTNSLSLVAASSQYADRADSASLSITSDLSLRAQIKPTTLPAVGSTQTLIAKWTEAANLRSYRFDIAGVSGYFGSGTNGSLTISTNTTEAPIDSACTGLTDSLTLSATNVSFAAGQIILIHQSQGTGAGTQMRNTIVSYTAGAITLTTPLNADYTVGAQVRVLKQYTNVTINTGVTYTAKAWNGTTGGILAFIASGTITINGTISADYCGFRGGLGAVSAATGIQGEGTAGTGIASSDVNASGGGGGRGSNNGGSGGGGGSNATAGANGKRDPDTSAAGDGAVLITGANDLTTMTFGGAGGGGGADDSSTSGQRATGGNGGGILFLIGTTLTISGTGLLSAGGQDGTDQSLTSTGCVGGGGAGGSILLKAQTATLGTLQTLANPGQGGSAKNAQQTDQGNAAAGNGYIHLDYYSSFTGTATPTLDATQDNTLVTNTSYQLRLSLSSNGTNVETLAQVVVLATGLWQQVGVTWDASASTAVFYLNAMQIGTSVGALTSISDNASRFGIGKYIDGASAAAAFYNGLIDEVQVFSNLQSDSDFVFANSSQVAVNAPGLVAYYKLNNSYNDATANTNNLTASGSPVFSSDVPFPSPSTRLDIDQAPSPEPTGDTYTLPTSISEAGADRLTFTPEKDPQKSIAVNVSAVGTGDWTLTVHDSFNNVVASKTIANAMVVTGFLEFVFATVWRPTIGQAYHLHLTVTTGTSRVVSSANNNLETAAYYTYYQFLVEDDFSHAIATKMINFIVILNERYLATWDSLIWQPNRIVFSSGWRSRCYGYWHEFLAVGCIRGDTITGTEQGRIYFWDGISDTFNFYIDVPEGGVNAMLGSKGNLYIDAGYLTDLMVYQGGDAANKLKRIPKIQVADTAAIYPGAMTMWRALLHYGVAGESNSTTIEKGVYSWGSLNASYTDTLSYDYPISTGNRSSSVAIGLTIPVATKLLIGWMDNVSFGMDVVDPAGAPFTSGTIEYLLQRGDYIWRDQMAVKLRGDFLPLNTGESIDIKFKLDRASNWTTLTTPFSTSSGTAFIPYNMVENEINPGRNREYQVAIDLFTTVSTVTSPTVLGTSLYQDLLVGEQQF